jgi:sialidase-1
MNRALFLILAPLAAAILSASTVRQTAPETTDVFVAGSGGYHTYRIPSVILTPKGTLIALAEGRREGAGDAGDIDLVLRRSRDAGATWLPMEVIGDNGPNTFGNPCLVVDARTGTIWLLTTQNLGTDKEPDIIAGRSAAGRSVRVMKSDDDGVTWSAPVDISAAVKRPDWTWYATGPGIGIQASGGRLVIPANHADRAGVHRSHLILSDDGGRTWRIGAISDPGTNESQAVELSDGRLMLNMRNHPPLPDNFRMVATSSDGGATLSPARADRALIEPPAQASVIKIAPGAGNRRSMMLFSNPASARRERMTVRLSKDDGQTWPLSRVVHEGPSAYSVLVALPGGAAGLLYERGERSPYERITFTRFGMDWLQ